MLQAARASMASLQVSSLSPQEQLFGSSDWPSSGLSTSSPPATIATAAMATAAAGTSSSVDTGKLAGGSSAGETAAGVADARRGARITLKPVRNGCSKLPSVRHEYGQRKELGLTQGLGLPRTLNPLRVCVCELRRHQAEEEETVFLVFYFLFFIFFPFSPQKFVAIFFTERFPSKIDAIISPILALPGLFRMFSESENLFLKCIMQCLRYLPAFNVSSSFSSPLTCLS